MALAVCCKPAYVDIQTPEGELRLTPMADNAVRVSMAQSDAEPLEELFYTQRIKTPEYQVLEDDNSLTVKQKGIVTVYSKATGRLEYFSADGRPLTSEISGSATARSFSSSPEEHIYGLGQFQDGFLDVKGISRRLTQVNTQISIPFVLSSRGYGILWNSYTLTEFNPCDNRADLKVAGGDGFSVVNATSTAGNRREMRFYETFTAEFSVDEPGEYALLLDVGQSMARKHWLAIDDNVLTDCNNLWLPPTTSVRTTLSAGAHNVEVRGVKGDSPVLAWRKIDETTTFDSPSAQRVDYTVFAGGADEIVGTYRTLTGPAPLMPSWALGYIHCRERYDSQKELLENARMFREKNIPIDVIVQDWQWWGKYGWNSMQFDEDKYPSPAEMVDSLHSMDIRLMLSVWSKVDKSNKLGRTLSEKGYYIDDTEWIDYFNPEAAQFYWQNFRDSLVRYGIDSWWFDATEPENDDLAGRREAYRNVYPLKVVETIYNGLKEEKPSEEPVILTRSMAPGIQRYGAVCWSGDVGNDWETLRRQIAGGLGLVSCGLPWWTYDAGGFFRPTDQYSDAAYQERMIRWIQTSVYLPIMRVHGYMSQTEPWRYPEDTEQLFVAAIRQRYDLLPYIEECARKVSEEGYTMMRPLVFDFPDDEVALEQDTEYMFGPRYLVCPVLAEGVSEMEVYLPANASGWTDTRDGRHYDGGQRVVVPVDINAIPVFEKI